MPIGIESTIAEIKRALAEARKVREPKVKPPRVPEEEEEEIPGVLRIALQRLMRLKRPQVYTAALAGEMGIEIDPDWLLKISPGRNGEEPAFTFMTPKGKEVAEEDILIYPEGKWAEAVGYVYDYEKREFVRASAEEIAAREEWPAEIAPGKLSPEEFIAREKAIWQERASLFEGIYPELFVGFTEEQKPDIAIAFQNMLAKDERAQEQFLETVQDIGRTPGTERLLKVLMPALTEEDIGAFFAPIVEAEVGGIISDVFPAITTTESFLSLVENEPARFVEQMQLGGRTKEKQDLLRAMGMEWDEINKVFEIQKLVVPVDGVSQLLTINTATGRAFDQAGKVVGTYNVITKEFTKATLGDKVEDFFNAWTFASVGGFEKAKQFGLSVLPQLLFRDMTTIEREIQGDEWADETNRRNKNIRDFFRAKSAESQRSYEDWVAKHPELQPNPVYEEGAFKHPELWKDPNWWAYEVASMAPLTLTALAAGATATLATGGNIMAGAVAAGLTFGPVEAQSVYEDLLAEGVPEDEAAKLAAIVAVPIVLVESAGTYLQFTRFLPQLRAIFRKAASEQLAKLTVGQMVKKGITTFTVLQFTETMEEVIQEALGNTAVIMAGKDRSLFEGIPELIPKVTAGMLPFSLIGTGVSLVRVSPSVTKGKTEVELKTEGFIQDPENKGKWYQQVDTETGEVVKKPIPIPERPEVVPPAVKPIWQMTRDEFKAIADKGKLVEATGISAEAVKMAETPLSAGELAGFSQADIAHFYAFKRGAYAFDNEYIQEQIKKGYDPYEVALEELKTDAITEGRPTVPTPVAEVPERIISKFTEIKPIEFNRAIDKAPKQEFLTRYTSEELEGSRLFLSEDKLVGYAVKPDGELFNLFNASGVKGAGQEAMVQGIVKGATSLNCMSGFLSDYYSDFGFVTERSEKWNEAFAPEGWDYTKYGRPDIIWMRYPKEGTRDADNIRESYRVAGDRRLAVFRRGQVPPARPGAEIGRPRRRAVPVEEPRAIEEPVRAPPEAVVPPVVPPVEVKPKVAPKIPITTQLKDLYSQIGTEVKAFQAAVKGLTGEEARVARETLKGLERELQYTGRTLETFAQKPDIPEATVLRSTIMAWAKMKGLPKGQLQDIFSSVAGRRQLRVIPQEQLVEILDKVRAARPKRIYGKTVITPKTEKKIATLKDTLIRTKKLTEKSFNHLMEQFNLPTAKYEYAHKFITESEAKALIRAMNDEAVLAEWDIKVEESLDRHPDIKTARDAANARSIKEREVTFDEKPIRISRGNELRSMRYYVLKLQKEMDAPIYDLWQKINMTHLTIRHKQQQLYNKLEQSTPGFRAIGDDETALRRVEDHIASKHKMGPKSPADITAEEIKLANELERQLFEFRNDVRHARFTEAYAGHSGDVDMIARDIPDANKRALRRAADIFEGKGATELRKFLDTQEWGVIRSGYNPLSVVKPKLYLYTAKPTTFAKGHIQTREGTGYTAEDRNILQRYRSYTKQIIGLTDLAPLVRAFDRVFTEHAYKLENYKPVASVLSRGINEMKGYQEDGGLFVHIVERLYAQVAAAVFWRPDLVLRNKFQNWAFNPDFHQGLFMHPQNKFMSKERRAWFELFVTQNRGIIQDVLFREMKPIPGFGRLTRLANRTSGFPWSDHSNRAEAFMVRMNRVDRALAQYEKDGDLKKLMNNSGLIDFEPRQQAEALELLAMDSVDYGVEGMPAVTGKEAFARYNGQQLTNNVHFLYDRSQRSPAAMGASGKVLGNIFVFQRSWAERFLLQGNKIIDPKVGAREKFLALRIVVGMIVCGVLAGEAYKKITGKKMNPYNPLNILTYGPGGLMLGITESISNVMYLITQAVQGDEGALGSLPGALSGVADLTLPFYRNLCQALESVTDLKNIDALALRKIREMIDDEYEVRGGAHEVERTLLEKLQHALLAGITEPPTPQKKVTDAEEMLGSTIEEEDKPFSIEEPDIYDMRKFNTDLSRILGDIPAEDITEKNDYSTLAIAWLAKEASEAIWKTQPGVSLYKINADPKEGDTFEEYYRQWQERKGIKEPKKLKEFDDLYPRAHLGNISRRQHDLLKQYHSLEKPEQAEFLEKHPDLKDNLRNEWLKANPIDNARLAIWGQAKILSIEAYNEVKRLIKELDIPDDGIPEFTLPPEGSVENYFKYNETGEEFGWNSWETQLLLAQDDDLREFLEREPIDTPIASLELKVKHRDLFDQLDAYGDKDSPLYIEDDEAREEAVKKLKTDNPEWVDDTRRIEAIEHDAPEEIIGAWVERGNVIDEFSAGSSEAKVWLIDYPEAHKWALDQELLTDDGSDWNVPVLRINVKWRPQDDQYEGMSDEDSEYYITDEDERKEARELMKRHLETGNLTEYGIARYRRDAYSLEGPTGEKFPEKQIENYVKYYNFPAKGFRQERFLLETEGFGKAMHEIAGIDLPDPKKVPAVQYDEIYEKWQADFERLEGLSDHDSEHYIEDPDKRELAREAMRFDTKGRLTEFGKAEIRKKGYGLFVPEKYIDRFVEFDSLRAEKRQVDYPDGMTWYGDEWYLFDHPLFYRDIYRGLFGLEEIDFSKVPHSKWRGLWENWTELDFQYEGVSDRKSEFYIADEDTRKEYREQLLSTNPKYRQARRKRDALLLKLPDDYLDDYAGYYEIPFTDKAKSLDPFYKEHPDEPYYEDDWYLKEHPEFYKAMLALRDKDGFPIWEPRKGFNKVPTREVHALYKEYLELIKGKPREDFRWEHRDLDAWLLLVEKVTVSITEKRRRAALTPQERLAEELREMEERLKR